MGSPGTWKLYGARKATFSWRAGFSARWSSPTIARKSETFTSRFSKPQSHQSSKPNLRDFGFVFRKFLGGHCVFVVLYLLIFLQILTTLLVTNISHQKSLLKILFLFPRGDVSLVWMVIFLKLLGPTYSCKIGVGSNTYTVLTKSQLNVPLEVRIKG